MATTDADPDTHAHDDHGHDHDHPSFLAHHFDTPEQQFDSGKLGIWIFLVTEVLFFSGMFCAYALFRALRPDVFEGCSQFLNTKLGAINTGVLLFSSLTMALAVRCSQVEDHKGLAAMLASTLSCAMVFLGVKTIEYSHKWGMGLLPAGSFFYDPANPHPTAEQLQQMEFSPFASYFLTHSLYFLCAPFAVALVGVLIWWVASLTKGKTFQAACAKPLFVVCLSFFLGVGLGMVLESGGESHDGDSHAVAHVDGHEGESHEGDGEHAAGGDAAEHEAETHDEGDHDTAVAASEPVDVDDLGIQELLASDPNNTGLVGDLTAMQRQAELAGVSVLDNKYSDTAAGAIEDVPENVLTPSRAGVFFSIYYCMTGVHAIHILAGIGVLVWLLVRAIRLDFNRHYFGPVDYVGLYWHLVDLIWIYLFPLLYLIR